MICSHISGWQCKHTVAIILIIYIKKRKNRLWEQRENEHTEQLLFWYMGLILTELTSPVRKLCYTAKCIKWPQSQQRDFNFCWITVISWAQFVDSVLSKQNTRLKNFSSQVGGEKHNMGCLLHPCLPASLVRLCVNPYHVSAWVPSCNVFER